ncbi:2-oxoglutarate dehydrogenase complex dihydrolipoyllysine-residue succinyltransferase [Pantoea sp. Mhis]|uniref:2-oxoglutarate dehydrogenase complex dihydrolipoyllysine-residue succinyltransferase n=1 Tax=Pantoea sp. Mhis TaxID=2576759 RepID=UPI001358E48C|nr:2-oxoglutarate dehydrogenase complex dihydrolipoyllysine-residue succinyltransferase [Pantoea sp. Mhis]MXP56287.1 2-oxoglutarate dehydrogenase complex dihydrolipoyllysine-residue succinyltransferase [Pantoea sp. Mhis]
MNSVEILVPDLPESVSDATVATWYKKVGESVNRDEILVDIETDKVILEVPASIKGILEKILEQEGATVTSRQVLGFLKEENSNSQKITKVESNKFNLTSPQSPNVAVENDSASKLSPAIRRLILENNVDVSKIKGTGIGGRIIREDIDNYLIKKIDDSKNTLKTTSIPEVEQTIIVRNEQRVPMTRLRKRLAERLLDVKNSTAMLTTFNEVNMKSIIDIRKHYGDIFEKRHGVRLGFMSFYIKAVLEGLKRFPEINASIDGDDIVYHNYFDISIAVSTPRGLVTPVLNDVDTFSMADIEKKVKELALKGRDGKLTVEELTGGNFTITNGGVFGSLMSTPIINPPQSAILGIHVIKDRPVAIDKQIVIMPMMYLALSYDHRLIDGRESVGYLMLVKDILEDPARIILDI